MDCRLTADIATLSLSPYAVVAAAAVAIIENAFICIVYEHCVR